MSPAMEHVVAEDIKAEDIVIDISAGKIKKNSNRYPMLKNETITIEATFTPRDCDVDFALIAPDGRFLGGILNEY